MRSGWHTAAIWMKLMVAHRRRVEAGMGAGAPRLGPSPGFRNLKWLKPVFAGDTVTYSSTVIDKRASASRPGWGLVFHRNEGVNQKGEPVFFLRRLRVLGEITRHREKPQATKRSRGRRAVLDRHVGLPALLAMTARCESPTRSPGTHPSPANDRP